MVRHVNRKGGALIVAEKKSPNKGMKYVFKYAFEICT